MKRNPRNLRASLKLTADWQGRWRFWRWENQNKFRFTMDFRSNEWNKVSPAFFCHHLGGSKSIWNKFCKNVMYVCIFICMFFGVELVQVVLFEKNSLFINNSKYDIAIWQNFFVFYILRISLLSSLLFKRRQPVAIKSVINMI